MALNVSKLVEMRRNGSNWVKIGPTECRWVRMASNGSNGSTRSKKVQIGQNCLLRSKQAQTGPNRSKGARYEFTKLKKNTRLKICSKWPTIPKMILNGRSWFYMVQNDQNGPKGSNMVYYDLLRSNMWQTWSTKSSKMVRHNQVSWSSFFNVCFFLFIFLININHTNSGKMSQ